MSDLKFLIRKNLLDIEERTYRTYYTTSLIVALTGISVLAMLYIAYEQFLVLLLLIFPLILLFLGVNYRSKADSRIADIKALADSFK